VSISQNIVTKEFKLTRRSETRSIEAYMSGLVSEERMTVPLRLVVTSALWPFFTYIDRRDGKSYLQVYSMKQVHLLHTVTAMCRKTE